MSYGTPYIATPITAKAVGRVKMTKSTLTAEKPVKKYAKTRGEHYKDIIIAILVAGVIAFVGGMHFADQRNAQMQNAVKAASAPVAQTEAKK